MPVTYQSDSSMLSEVFANRALSSHGEGLEIASHVPLHPNTTLETQPAQNEKMITYFI